MSSSSGPSTRTAVIRTSSGRAIRSWVSDRRPLARPSASSSTRASVVSATASTPYLDWLHPRDRPLQPGDGNTALRGHAQGNWLVGRELVKGVDFDAQ